MGFSWCSGKGNEYAVRNICNEVLKEFGVDREVSIEKVLELYGESWSEYYQELIPDARKYDISTMCERSEVVSHKMTAEHLKPMDGAHETLSKIQKKSGANLLISNTRPGRLEDFLEMIDTINYLHNYFGVGRDFETCDFDIVDYKADRVLDFVREEDFGKIINVGDQISDMRVGQRIGAINYLFRNPDSPYSREPPSSEIIDYKINDLKDVLDELE